MPPVRDLQSLSPVQFPPKNLNDWSNWKRLPPRNMKAWEVLEIHAQFGNELSGRLLSEGRGKTHPRWLATPLEKRLFWMGRYRVNQQTLSAFQLMVTEVWNPPVDAPIA